VAAGAAALALGSAAAVSVATGATAQAASPCTTSGTTVTCTYTGAGTYSFPVPSGVTSLDVTAVGAAGGASTTDGGDFSAGGAGASVKDTAVPVNAYLGQMLTVIVGGPGGAGTLDGSAGAGGAPGGGGDGGGGGDFPGGGGGGYSGLLDPSGTTALVIAAGGGGGGFDNPDPVAPGLFTGGAGDTGSGGGTGGGAASLGLNAGCPTSDSSSIACGGTGGTSTAGGEGGAGGAASGLLPGALPGVKGGDGASLAGGPGGPSGLDAADNPGGGGGGGGGYYGGGGGGSSFLGAGGGGGSSFGITGLTNEATATAAASVTITYEAPLAVTTTSLPAATGGRSYTATLAATGGVTPYSWSVPPGTLPPGLSLSAAGVISGIPDVAGTYTFTVTVTDSEHPPATATKRLSITVSGPVITGLTPDHGTSFGTLVKITGTGLACPRHAGFSCQVSVTFGGHRAFVLVASPTAILVIAPPGHGTVQVTVKVGGVSSHATTAGLFTYQRIGFPL
jgi:Putative Ig domain